MHALGRLPLLGALARWTWSLLNVRDTRITAHLGRQEASHAQQEAARLRDEVSQLRHGLQAVAQTLDGIGELRQGFDRLRAEQDNLRRDISNTGQRLLDIAASSDVELDRRLVSVLADISSVARRLVVVERETQRVHATLAAQEAVCRPAVTTASMTPPATAFDSMYVEFQDAFRGSREEIKRRVSVYVDRIASTGMGMPETPVLDLGAGRGEWLELLHDHGLTAYGVDSNAFCAVGCRQLGLDVRHEDALTHLSNLPNASLGAITAFHVVEHLDVEGIIQLLDQALRVLMPGGVLLLETPNPENILVGARNFWFDPTHHHPIPPPILDFLVSRRGFSDVEVVRLHPYPDQERLPRDQELGRRLDALISGPQDYAVIARRP